MAMDRPALRDPQVSRQSARRRGDRIAATATHVNDVVADLLSDLDDTLPISAIKLAGNPALKQLVGDYQHFASLSTRTADYDATWSGAEFKNRITLLKSEQQVMLLYRYLDATDAIVDERRDSPAQRLQRQLIRIVIGATAVCAVMLFGAITVIAVRSGKLPSNELVDTFLETATEIVKLLFENSKAG